MRQGIISNDDCTLNCIKLRINAKDKSTSNPLDNAITNAYGNKLIIPLNFEMLDIVIPYYQSGFRNRLCYEITFNEYGRFMNASGQTPTSDAKHNIKDIVLECKIVTQLDLEKMFRRIPKQGFVV